MMSLLEKKLADKKQQEFLQELREAAKVYAAAVNELMAKYQFVNYEEGGRQEALGLVRAAIAYHMHNDCFYTPYAMDLKVKGLTREAILDHAIDELLNKGALE